MTSIRKAKKWYKSTAKKGFKKRLKTIRKCPAWHAYIMRHRTFKRAFVTFTIRTKSKRKRGKHEKKIL